MPDTTPTTHDLAELIIRLETVLDRIENRLEETAHLPLIETFLSDELSQPRDLFSMPSFEITTPS